MIIYVCDRCEIKKEASIPALVPPSFRDGLCEDCEKDFAEIKEALEDHRKEVLLAYRNRNPMPTLKKLW